METKDSRWRYQLRVELTNGSEAKGYVRDVIWQQRGDEQHLCLFNEQAAFKSEVPEMFVLNFAHTACNYVFLSL